MPYVRPEKIVETMVETGAHKAGLKARDILIRGFLSGILLGYATSLAFTGAVQTDTYLVGALIFPAGFAMIILLGLELVTSNFALVPLGVIEGRAPAEGLFKSWSLAFLGNLAGSLLYAALFYVVATKWGHVHDAALIKKVIAVAEAKTVAYAHLGPEGLAVAFVSAVLCNMMVALGAVMAFSSTSTIGKIAAMWLPILAFFAQGYEHSVVNMFVIPAGMLLGAKVTVSDWWLWNQLPVTAGNIVGGMFFTGLLLYLTHTRNVFEKLASNRVERMIGELESEHARISSLLENAREIAPETEDGMAKLLSIRANLIAHLEKEDEEFYPAMRRLANTNRRIKDALETFARDMEENSTQAIRLLKRYEDGATPRLKEDLGKLFASFKERMARESGLLDEYKRLKAA